MDDEQRDYEEARGDHQLMVEELSTNRTRLEWDERGLLAIHFGQWVVACLSPERATDLANAILAEVEIHQRQQKGEFDVRPDL